jgi:hypothetical protein
MKRESIEKFTVIIFVAIVPHGIHRNFDHLLQFYVHIWDVKQRIDAIRLDLSLNRSKAIAPNVYLMLYPKSQRSEAANWSDLVERIWQALKKIPTESLVGEGRIYGGGLHKLEPKELSSANVEFLLTELPELKDIVSSNGYNLFSPP